MRISFDKIPPEEVATHLDVQGALEGHIKQTMGPDFLSREAEEMRRAGIYKVTAATRRGVIVRFIPVREIEGIVAPTTSTSYRREESPSESLEGEAPKAPAIEKGESSIKSAQALSAVMLEKGIDSRLDQQNGESDFEVVSEEDFILSLPWELLNEAYVRDNEISFKRIVPINAANPPKRSRNFVACISYGCVDSEGDIGGIADGITAELKAIDQSLNHTLNEFLQRRHDFERPNLFQVTRFITRASFQGVQWGAFQIAHIIAHGKNGFLAFESDRSHWKIEWAGYEVIIKILERNGLRQSPYDLFFIAACHSASANSKAESSLAFRIVKSSLSRYSIGFNGGMGGDKALPGFSEVFYKNYLVSWNMEAAFLRASRHLIQENSRYWHLPYLYKGELKVS